MLLNKSFNLSEAYMDFRDLNRKCMLSNTHLNRRVIVKIIQLQRCYWPVQRYKSLSRPTYMQSPSCS